MTYITGTESAETINTWWGVTDGFDVIYGYGGDDTIYALGGDDSLIGGAGADTIYGGFGNDTAFYFDSDVEVYVDLASGRGYAGTAQGDRLYDVENVYGSYYGDWLAGNASPNRLVGGAGEDWLKGGGGADRLEGGTENDTLDGGTDADTMIGGRGDDTFYVDHGDDVLTEAWSEGNEGC
jgi:Ca2+-binding RTX toxin-like protein